MLRKLICDIDGVLADNSLTHHLDCTDPAQHAQFARMIPYVEPLPAWVDVVRSLAAAGWQIYLFTARSECLRITTTNWLYDNRIPFKELFMRPFGNTEESYLLKKEMLDNLLKACEGESYGPIAAIEDDEKTVHMYAKAGVKALLAYDLKKYFKEDNIDADSKTKPL